MAGQGGAAGEIMVDDAGDLFDNIDDLLHFPDDAGAGVLDGWGRGSDLLGCGALLPAASGSAFSGPDSAADDDLGAGLSVPTEDIPELDWFSSFVEDSFSAGSFGLEAAVEEEDRRGRCHKDGSFRTSSPISVLDSTSSTSSRKLAAAPLLVPHIVIPSRARSKLPRRPATFRFCKPLVTPESSTDETDPHSSMRARFLSCSNFSLEFDSIVELRQRKKMVKKTKKKHKLFVAAAAASDEAGQPVRKCTHCEIQKTPQWRAGPMGPKTLCNACGVRYKSGRLFPEYRPAASPTFVPALHSNSHKKVLEMRDEMGQRDPAPVPQFVRKTSHCGGIANGGTKKSSLIHEVK